MHKVNFFPTGLLEHLSRRLICLSQRIVNTDCQQFQTTSREPRGHISFIGFGNYFSSVSTDFAKVNC